MIRTVKWLFIIGIGLITAVVAAVILLPKFVNVSQYKPRIEAQVTKATGRAFRIGDDLRLSIFPYLGLSFSDLHLGNLSGLKEKDFIVVKSSEVRVKFLPLLFKDIQVKRFTLKGARIVLETGKDGRNSWDFSEKTTSGRFTKTLNETHQPEKDISDIGLTLKDFTLDELAVTDGSVLWLDQKKKLRKEISDVDLLLQDVSLDRPFNVIFSGRFDKKPFALEGHVGPIGKMVGKKKIPLNLSVKVLDQLKIELKGDVADPATQPKFDVAFNVSTFSPRKLVAAMGMALPISTSDPGVMNRISVKAGIKGEPKNILVSDGVLDFDESKVNFMIKVDNFTEPHVAFNMDVDKIDLDQYLPPAAKKEPGRKGAKTPESKPNGDKKTDGPKPKGTKKTDYSTLRRLSLNGTIRLGKLKIKNAKIEHIQFTLAGEKGIFNLHPFTMSLYQGDVSGKGTFSVRSEVPQTNIHLTLNDVQAGPLFNDLFKKDFLEGTLDAKVNLNMKGNDAVAVKRTLNGNGDLLFKDGAIKGVDLDLMVHNVKAAFGRAEKGEKEPRTDFSQLSVPFSINNGLVSTTNTSLISPLIRMTASGKADLIKELLDFRLEPKIVGTLKGQGDTKNRSGFMVPVMVTGNFSSPKFRPDLEEMLKKEIGKSLPILQKKLSGTDTDAQKDEIRSVEEQIKGILKGLGQ